MTKVQSSLLVSVLMPSRDAAGTIDEVASRILAQRKVPLELIAIDDGSGEDGPPRVARLAARDARDVLVDAASAGIAASLNWFEQDERLAARRRPR